MMGIIQAPPHRWVKTDPLPATPVSISGTGTAVVTSSVTIPYVGLPDFAQLAVAITLDLALTGGSGLAHATVRFARFPGQPTSTADGLGAEAYVPRLIAGAALRTRRVLFTPDLVHSAYAAGIDAFTFEFRGWGSAAESEWAVTNGQVRVLYVPL